MGTVNWKALSEKAHEENKSGSGFLPLEEGSYHFKIVDMPKVEQAKDGSPMLKVIATVDQGDRAKAKVWHNVTYSMSGGYGLVAATNFVKAFGLGIDDYVDGSGELMLEKVANHLVNRSFTASVVHRPNPKDDARPYVNLDLKNGAPDSVDPVDDSFGGATAATPSAAPPKANTGGNASMLPPGL